MRVAVIAPPRFPIREPFGGGLEAQVWNSCRALRARGVHVDLYGASGSDFAAPDLSFPLPDWTSSPCPPTDATLPPSTVRAHDRLMTELLDQLAVNERGYDLVHNHCLYPQPLERAADLPMPMVTTLHTRPIRELTDVIGAEAGAFVAVSGYVRDAWSTLRPRPAVIHNGIDVARWTLGSGGDDLAWFGRIIPEKAPHLALEAARLAGRHLLMAGRIGDADYFATEVAPRLGRHATYLGPLRHAELARMVGRCRATLVTPTLPEPFGLIAAESAACGTPVIAFDVGALGEVVIEGITGTVVPAGDITAMAAAVGPVGRLDRGRANRAVRGRFGIATMTERYLALYDGLVSAREPSSA